LNLVGKTINGRYKINSEIGDGGMSKIYLAYDKDKTPISIKFLKSKTTSHRLEDLIRFRTEATTVSRFEHQNIVKTFDIGETDGLHYIVMEYIEGESLYSIIQKKHPFDINKALDIIEQIAAALDYIHSKGIIHRDLKPGNIMCIKNDYEYKIKIIDFGLAQMKDFNEITASDEIVGTFSYMSPEQSGILKRKVDERSDLYSLGIIAYELLTGELPFKGKDINSIIHQHIAQIPARPSDINKGISPTLEKIILKLMEKEPENRYQSGKGLLADLKKLRQGKEGFIIAKSDSALNLSFTTMLVGREKEINRLKKLCAESIGGMGAFCFLSGEEGFGKSRIIEEIKKFVIMKNGIFIGSRCFAAKNNIPYIPFKEALVNYIQIFEKYSSEKQKQIKFQINKKAGELGKIIIDFCPEAKCLIDSVPKLVSLEPERENRRFLGVISQFFKDIAKIEGGMALTIDDIHWADNASLSLFYELIQDIDHYPLFIIAISREDGLYKSGNLTKFREEITGNNINIEEIKLEALNNKEMNRLIAGILFQNEKDIHGISDFIFQKSKGNPLFAIELLKQLIDSGSIYKRRNRWSMDKEAIKNIEISTAIIDIILKRINMLAEKKKKILSYASAIGKNFEIDFLFEISKEKSLNINITNQEIVELIEKASDLQLVEWDKNIKGEVIFTHERIKEAFGKLLTREEKRIIHLKTAEIMEKQLTDFEDKRLFDIVTHYIEAGKSQKLLQYLVPAANLAKNLHANKDAIYYFSKAIDVIEAEGRKRSPVWINCIEQLGELSLISGEFDRSIELFKSILPYKKTKLEKAQIYEKICSAFTKKGNFEICEKYGQEGLRLLGETLTLSKSGTILSMIIEIIKSVFAFIFYPISIRKNRDTKSYAFQKDQLIIAFYLSLSWTYIRNDLTKFVRSAMRTYNISRIRMGKSKELGSTMGAFASLIMAIGLFGWSLKLHNKSLAIRKELNDEWGIGQAYQWIGYCYQWMGEFEESTRYFNMSIEIFEKIGDIWEYGMGVQGLELNYLYLGQYHKCLDYLHKYIRICEKIFDDAGKSGAYSDFVWLNNEQGEFALATQWAKKARECARENNVWLNYCINLIYLSQQKIILGDYEEAVKNLVEAKRINEKYRLMDQYVNVLYPDLLEAYVGLYRDEINIKKRKAYLKKARKLKYLAVSKTKNWKTHYGKALRIAGQFYRTTGNFKKAEHYFKASLNENSKRNRKYEIAITLYQYAILLKQLNNEKEAQKRLESAYRILKEIESKYLLKKIGEMLGIHEEQSSAIEKLQIKQRLTSIININQDISSILNLDELLEHIMAKAIEVTGAQRIYLFLKDKQSDNLEIRASKDIIESAIPQYSKHIVDKVYKSGKSMITSNAEQEEDFLLNESVVMYHLKSVLCIPIKRHEKVIGVCYLDNPLSSSVFTIEDEDILSVFMTQAAIAIENASLYQNLEKEVEERSRQLRDAYGSIKTDLRLAKRIQENILPKNISHILGINFAIYYAPMTEVGGDFYDVFEFAPGIIRIFVADATGHGVQAALMTMLLKGEYERVKTLITLPSELLEIMNNEIIYTYKSLEVFFTCIVLDIDLNDKKIRYASAGHPTQYLISNKKVIKLNSTGKMAGTFVGNNYNLVEHDFTPGDKIILFTDGLFEEFDKNDNEFGEDRVNDIIKSKFTEKANKLEIMDMVNILINEVENFIGSEEKNDDITIVGIG